MAGLSREVLKWLQSLDLSYSVKNVKRDFANGFLVAEIFSRYFPHDVQMHSYDNGIGLPKKLGNWALLEKFFMRKRVPISRELIDDVIHCKNDAAIPLLETIYTCLTSKKVHNVIPRSDDELIPPFARPTASKAIKENIKDSELVTTLQDDAESRSRASNVLQSHQQSLRNERLQEPGRFTGPSSPQRSSQRVPPRAMPAEAPQGQVEFKEVQVRPINRNIATLRATRDVNSTMPKSDDEAQREFNEMDAKALQVKPITHVLNGVVNEHLEPKELRLLDQSKDSVVSLVDRLVASKIDPEAARKVFEEMVHNTDDLVSGFLASPKEFWRMFSIFTGVLHLPETNVCYTMVLRLFCEIGARMTAEDPFLACGLFGDYGLPKIVPLLKTKPAKRKGLLGMMYFFCESTMHLRVIKALQDSLDDMDCFLQCIVILMHLEPEGFSEDLLDLYIYYAMTGLGHQSATLRASALSMVVLVVRQSHLLVMPMLDKLEAMKDDGWWEVSAQLLRVCAQLLQVLLPQDEQCGRVCDLVTEIVENTYSPLVRKMAVSCLAPVLSKYTSLEAIYHKALDQLSEKDFSTVMAAPDPSAMELGDPQQQVLGNSLAHMPITSPLNFLDPLLVVQSLSDKIRQSNLENLEPEHVHILLGVLEMQFEPEQADQWYEVLKDLELHVYVALADDELCTTIVSVLHRWITYIGQNAISTFETLGKALKLVFSPDGGQATPIQCQVAAKDLVLALRSSGEPFAGEVDKVVATLNNEQQNEVLQELLHGCT
uniref:Spermatogenesis-associated protein 4 n=1 Tax=Hemiselmis tepida TaxID=464990 RepID=A0A7S0W760_9CRYP|mmetsp:Transcript_4215/g.10779  ORF Transcript_4215/g.10779 Transcript_4215/m.10779 type:complete len:770 (+) Transcript_4215:43-2352(+)|eukprot:CAMPEP_0174931020 /NCGR_PEP_ID=MMETSP1355-20121228/31918_1 /TAXON_ID=464990 /ORGANISM="Hemiselmis tepida, Strain CCMP443" /LENGTH=769 /DNA_ID=CAMNT_0016177343 /DNA_START=43 /DNA_END=2352 /DNA_ORIENTATION=-